MPPPVVISSAAPGKKAAPKAPVRRRPAPAAAAAPAPQTTPAPETAASSVPPPSPTPTQLSIAPEIPTEKEATPAPPEHAKPVEPTVEKLHVPSQIGVESVVEPASQPTPPIQAVATQIVVPPTPEPTQSPQPPKQIDVPQTRQKSPVLTAQQPEPAAPETDTREQPISQPEIVEPALRTQETLQNAPAIAAPAPKVNNKRARADGSTAAAPPAAKRTKRSSARSNAKVQAAIEEDAQPQASSSFTPANASALQATAEPEEAPKRKRATRKAAPKSRKATGKVKSAATIIDSDDEGETLQTQDDTDEEPEAPAPKPKAPRKSRAKKAAAPRTKKGKAAANQEQPDEAQEDQPEVDQAQEDEEDPEAHVIDEYTVSLYDLSYDSYHGKTSERGRQMAEIDWEEVAFKRRAAANAIVTGGEDQATDVVQSVEGTDNAAPSRNGDNAPSPQPARNQETIGFRLDHNGEIVADEVTLELARGEQERDQAENAPVEELNDLTVQLNRTTWINNNRRDLVDRVPAWKWRSDPWSEEETDKFYDAIRMFGTDFFIISKMFPPKTRRMIKAKFGREEKLDPQRINDALCGKEVLPMNLDHYCRETGKDASHFTKYDGIDHAQSIIDASMKDKQDELVSSLEQEATLAAEKDEEKKQKKQKSKESKKPRKKAKAGGTMGGGPDEVTETIEVPDGPVVE